MNGRSSKVGGVEQASAPGLPPGWEALRLKYFADLVSQKLTQKPDGVPYLALENIESESGRLTTAETPEEVDSTVCVFEPGDVLFGKLRPYLAKAFEAPFGGVCSSEFVVLRPKTGTNPRFLLYQLLSDGIIKRITADTYGVKMPRASPEQVANLVVAVPPGAAQRAIAAFLDRETAKIDALVAKKERLIELLEEKRVALITSAVTRGLDPNVPMKVSGVDWVPRVPAAWRVERNKILFRERDERSGAGEEELLTVSHITGVTRRSEKEVNMIEAESHEGYKLCETGDLVINTMWAWMGALGVAREAGMASPSYNVYCPDPRLLPDYLDYLCRIPIYVAELTRYSKGVWKSRLRLYPEDFMEIRTIAPSPAEQESIVSFLNCEVTGINDLASRVREAVNKLREYRTALISAAVTGKIDVRNVSDPGDRSDSG